MQSLRGKVALITGASSGIGAAIAEVFAKHRARLSLTGRKSDNLHDVASKTNLPRSDILATVGDMLKMKTTASLFLKPWTSLVNLTFWLTTLELISIISWKTSQKITLTV